MISSDELASTGSSPGTPSSTSDVELLDGLGDDLGGPGVQADGRADGDGLAGHALLLVRGWIELGRQTVTSSRSVAGSASLRPMDFRMMTAIAPTMVPAIRAMK